MKMEFIIDDEELKKANLTKEECLSKLRMYFDFKSNTIVEIEEGVFEGPSDNWEVFAAAINWRREDWFRKVVKEWYWTTDYREDLWATEREVFGKEGGYDS